MRGRIELQSTSCEMLRNVIPFRENSPQEESVRLADFRSANASPRRFCFSRRCLSAGGQRRAEMPNFVFYVAWIFDGLRDFLADEPAITPPQIVKLFFNRRLCYRQGSSQILIRNICAVRGKIKAQRLE